MAKIDEEIKVLLGLSNAAQKSSIPASCVGLFPPGKSVRQKRNEILVFVARWQPFQKYRLDN